MKQSDAAHSFDRLTGLIDRVSCLQTLIELVESAQRQRMKVAVLWIDIDRFKQFNHSLGHFGGDSVLAELARRLERANSHHGYLARVGGDEFALLLSGCTRLEAERVARNLLAALSQPMVVGSTQVRPAASIGIAVSEAGETARELFQRADRAKIAAKDGGGGRFLLSPPTPLMPRGGGNYLGREELFIEECLHRALETGSLYFHYQPILRVGDNRVETVEALMRCRDRGETVFPSCFIPVAEKTGLIAQLGDWSLVTAASFAGRLRDSSYNLKVAVNVSRAQLMLPSFVQSLHGVLAYSGIAPELIELEITESLFMDSSEVVRRNLDAACEAGFQLALDDFGTGYSSLACLKDLPVCKIKLDRAFVVNLPHDARSFGVAKAVTRLALDLGITVVAEGVESQEQYQALCDAGVTAMQGYHLAYPMEETALLSWLEERKR